MIGPLSYMDVLLIGLAAISGFLAMYRGISREVLSIASWAIALGAMAYFILNHEPLAAQAAVSMGLGASGVKIAQAIIGGVIFLAVLILVQILTSQLSDAILDSQVGPIDRVLGFLFGVARAYMIVLLLFMGYQWFFPDAKAQHEFVTKSMSKPIMDSGSRALQPTFLWLAEKIQQKITKDKPA
jgi:membrane protein required for colicin V production